MISLLQPGDRFRTASGRSGVVAEWLGEGAQGTVFAAELDGARLALKWYHPALATSAQRARLLRLLQEGAPHPAFLWPLDLAHSPQRPGFGYLMPLRPAGFHSFSLLMTRGIEASFSAAAEAGFQLAHAFLLLHARGLCYRDLSFGNLFLNPSTGEVRIADNDNVQPEGEPGPGGILGTPRFMAPELVRGDSLPSIQSDLFSLAVVLFYLLLLHHPLEGRREAEIHSLDLPAMVHLYGRHPLFIFDPEDDSNRPDPFLHGNAIAFWPMYPPFVRGLFVQAFGAGLHHPPSRVRESEWRQAMADLRDLTLDCMACGVENLHPDPFGPASLICWNCRSPLPRPLGLRFSHRTVLLAPGRILPVRSIQGASAVDSSRPFAGVVAHPSQPGRAGLKNLDTVPWRCRLPGHAADLDVVPTRSIALRPGLTFHWADPAEVAIV